MLKFLDMARDQADGFNCQNKMVPLYPLCRPRRSLYLSSRGKTSFPDILQIPPCPHNVRSPKINPFDSRVVSTLKSILETQLSVINVKSCISPRIQHTPIGRFFRRSTYLCGRRKGRSGSQHSKFFFCFDLDPSFARGFRRLFA